MLSVTQKREAVRSVQRLSESGHTIKSACDEIGIHWTNFYKWRRQFGSAKETKEENQPTDNELKILRDRVADLEEMISDIITERWIPRKQDSAKLLADMTMEDWKKAKAY